MNAIPGAVGDIDADDAIPAQAGIGATTNKSHT